MKRTILFLVCLMGMTFAFAQGNMQDVVYLKNGSIIRGEIIEMVSGETVKIQTADGSVFVHDLVDVESFVKEQSKGTAVFKKKSPCYRVASRALCLVWDNSTMVRTARDGLI